MNLYRGSSYYQLLIPETERRITLLKLFGVSDRAHITTEARKITLPDGDSVIECYTFIGDDIILWSDCETLLEVLTNDDCN